MKVTQSFLFGSADARASAGNSAKSIVLHMTLPLHID